MLELTPLAGPECRWAVARTWVFMLRIIAAMATLCIVLVASWYCWFINLLDPTFLPGNVLRGSLIMVASLSLIFAMLLSPAVLAGSLTGDPKQGILGILLTTRVSAGEIVLSRFISRLTQVGIVIAAGLPGVCFLAAYCGIGLHALAMLILLTTAVACGSAGIAVGYSILFTRARDSLIATYTTGLALLFLPTLIATWIPASLATWLYALNPFVALTPLIEFNQTKPAWFSICVWASLAPLGILIASWVLRPANLHRASGHNTTTNRKRQVPPLSGCPMRWKELNIESDKNFGLLVKIISRLLLLFMLSGSLSLLFLFIWSNSNRSTPEFVDDILFAATGWIKFLLLPMSWIIQWAVGIRAAAGIAAEKEHGTWDTLMMTPLTGKQIVSAKMVESFYSLRWFLAATLLVFLLGTMLEATDLYSFVTLATETALFVGLMSAIGVWSSLTAQTSGRAITLALAIWLVAKIFVNITAALLTLVAMLAILLYQSALKQLTRDTSAFSPQWPISFETFMLIFEVALCIGTFFSIAWYCYVKFDQLAGRCPERLAPVRIPK